MGLCEIFNGTLENMPNKDQDIHLLNPGLNQTIRLDKPSNSCNFSLVWVRDRISEQFNAHSFRMENLSVKWFFFKRNNRLSSHLRLNLETIFLIVRLTSFAKLLTKQSFNFEKSSKSCKFCAYFVNNSITSACYANIVTASTLYRH